MTAREEILGSIRRSGIAAGQTTAWNTLPRGYRSGALVDRYGVIQLFEERLLDYDATVTQCTASDIGSAISGLVSKLGLQKIVIPVGLDLSSIEGKCEVETDEGLTYSQLDRCDCVLTRCTLGIAETGTIVLQSGPGQGRRALSLVPDVHICIVNVSQIVATVPEAFDRLQPTAHLPTTFVSGPSATADIEMTRVKGVHGPRFLHVVLVQDEALNLQQHSA